MASPYLNSAGTGARVRDADSSRDSTRYFGICNWYRVDLRLYMRLDLKHLRLDSFGMCYSYVRGNHV